MISRSDENDVEVSNNEDDISLNNSAHQIDVDESSEDHSNEWGKPWEITRMQVSSILGSIGASPLSPPIHHAHTNRDSKTMHPYYLDMTYQLACSHVELIRAMDNAIEMLNKSTSLRLGLGVAHYGNEGVISRAEKAWAERQLKQNESDDIAHTSKYYPKLTLAKSRRILHHVMADQVTSLHTLFNSGFVHDESREWDEFLDDMHYFSQTNRQQSAPVLTLSKLSIWLERLRCLLSFVMSRLLCPWSAKQCAIQVSLLKQSTQIANENRQYLLSAFNISPTMQQKSGHESTTQLPRDESGYDAHKIISQMKSTLEAAQVSVWAMDQSILERNNQMTSSSDDSKEWFHQLKDLLAQTETFVKHFQSTIFVDHGENELAKHDDNLISTTNAADVHDANDTTELILAAPNKDLVTDTLSSAIEEDHTDKTWIFSASGIYKPGPRRRDIRTDKDVLAKVHESHDRTMLMSDLQKRLNSMQLAKEHNKVNLDPFEGERSEVKQDERHAAPFFMGAQGSLLSELTNALKSGNHDIEQFN